MIKESYFYENSNTLKFRKSFRQKMSSLMIRCTLESDIVYQKNTLPTPNPMHYTTIRVYFLT